MSSAQVLLSPGWCATAPALSSDLGTWMMKATRSAPQEGQFSGPPPSPVSVSLARFLPGPQLGTLLILASAAVPGSCPKAWGTWQTMACGDRFLSGLLLELRVALTPAWSVGGFRVGWVRLLSRLWLGKCRREPPASPGLGVEAKLSFCPQAPALYPTALPFPHPTPPLASPPPRFSSHRSCDRPVSPFPTDFCLSFPLVVLLSSSLPSSPLTLLLSQAPCPQG